jgi:hypothetical protein
MPPGAGPPKDTWARRIGWLVLLWTASVATLAIFALLIRVIMQAVGMTA